MLVGVSHAGQPFQDVKSTMCTPSSGIRVHRGLDPKSGISDTDLKTWYPGFPNGLKVCREWSKDGMWNSPHSDRLGMRIQWI